MRYEAVIGLEVHAQLLTKSKMFCGCSTKFGEPPNSQTCPICIGMPGVLPVMNKKAIEFTIKTGLALNCSIASYSRFARKNYFYPDLPKGYQISQYELPIATEGYIEIVVNGKIRGIGITRVHLEEDAGKNIHEIGASHVDLNRAGVPLMEIVSKPDIRSPEEASEYVIKLRSILRYLDVCDGNMEQGSLRCDANVSIRPVGAEEFGIKTEIKNMNSFKHVRQALEYEIKRQKDILEEEGEIIQETRLWEPEQGITMSMRTKEEAHDYRYFPEPDLVPVVIDMAWIDEIREGLPELPHIKRERFVKDYGLPEYDSDLLTSTKEMADYFEECLRHYRQPKVISNWIMGELMRLLNLDNKEIMECPIRPQQLVDMLRLIDEDVISGKIAKTVFEDMYRTGKAAMAIVKDKGLLQVSDQDELLKIIDGIIEENSNQVTEYKAGKEKLFGFFVGQVMKATHGKANPAMVNELLKKRLG